MTNEEAIEILENDIEVCTIQQKEACDMAKKALKQTDTLDRIITQIEQVRDKDKLCKYPYNRCIRIIEEYKEK